MPARGLAALAALLLSVAARAEEPAPDPRPGRSGADANEHAPAGGERKEESRRLFIRELRQLESLSDAQAGEAFALLGRVTIEVPRLFRVRAARMVVWLDPDADRTVFSLVKEMGDKDRGIPLWAVRAVYAEGGRAPVLFETPGGIFRCSSLYYDFQLYEGIVLGAELRLRMGADRTDLPDLVLRAEKFRATGPGEWRARDVRFFSSNYHEHEVVLEVRRVHLRDAEMERSLGRLTEIRAKDYRGGKGPTEEEIEAVLDAMETAGTTPAGKVATLYGIRAEAYGVPFAYWRKAEVEGDDLLPLIVEVDGGRGSLGSGARLGIGMRTRPVGWLVGFSYYDRGPMVDLTLTTRAWDGRLVGRTFGVYMHDHGSDRGIVPPSRDRYWHKHQYRFRVDDHWRIDLEAADLSDAEWLRAYDEREFKEGKEQETLLYLRRRGERGHLTLTGKVRTIGFLDVLEELPRATASLPAWTLLRLGEGADGEPIAVQLAATAEVGELRHRAGDASALPDFSTARADLDPTLYVAFDLGPVRVIPFASFRVTAWEQALDGSSEGRFAGTAGVRADLRLARRYGTWRHIMDFSLEYADLHTLTRPASDFFPLDDLDRITPYEVLGLRWRHRFQKAAQEGWTEVLSVELFGAWFPDGQQPLGRTGDAFFETDWEWRLRHDVTLSARTGVDLESGTLDTGSIEGWWRARSDLRLGAGVRHLEGDSDILTTSVEIDVDTRWRLVTFSQIDFKSSDGLDQGLLIQRLGKTAVIGLRFFYDPGDDDFSFGVKIDLLHHFRKERREREEAPRYSIGLR